MSTDVVAHEQFLSRRQRTTPIVLSADPSDEELARTWTLSSADMGEVLRCRGDAQRRRFALQLCTLAAHGRFLPAHEPGPLRVLNHLAVQLGMSPLVAADPPPREDTEFEHQQRIREHLKYRAFDVEAEETLERWIYERATEGKLPKEIFPDVETELATRRRIILPAPATLERLVASICGRAREEIFEHIEITLPESTKERLDVVLGPSGHRSHFFHLKSQPAEANPEVITRCIQQLRELEDLDVPAIDLGFLRAEMITHLSGLADCYEVDKLRRFAPSKRHGLVACFLVERYRELFDDLVGFNAQYLTGMSRRATNNVAKRRRQLFPQHRVRRTTDLLRDGFEMALARFEVEDVLLRSEFFARFDPEESRQTLAHYAEFCRLEERGYVDGLLARHGYLRRYLPHFLGLPFEAQPGSAGLLDAIRMARALPPGRPLPPQASEKVVPSKLREHLLRDDGTLDRRLWEIGLAMTVRDALKSGDLYLASSKRHVSFANMIYSDARWATERVSAHEELGLPMDPRIALASLRTEFEQAALAAERGLDANPFATVTEGGLRLHRGQEDRYRPTRAVRNLRRAIDAHLPNVRVEDLLWDIDARCGFLRELTPRGGYDSRIANLPMALRAAIVAHGTNLGISAMAIANEDVSAEILQLVSKWFLRHDSLRAANAAIVDYIQSLPLSAVYGSGGLSSSDGQRFAIRGDSVLGSFYPRHFGYYERALTVYTHALNFSVFSTQAISCTEREAMYVLPGLLEDDTALIHREHTTDTHGYTEHLFGLCWLLGFAFMPRIADLSDQQLYKLDRETRHGALEALFRGTIDLELIAEQWDPLARIAASLKRRTTKAQDLMQRLVNASPADRCAKALTALGRLLKTTYILRYIHDEQLRRRVQLQLNRGEARHALARRLFFGELGEFQRGDLQGIMNKASCLSLLSNAVVAWNLGAMTSIVERLRAAGENVRDEDLAHVWPLSRRHVAPYGTYRFLGPASLPNLVS